MWIVGKMKPCIWGDTLKPKSGRSQESGDLHREKVVPGRGSQGLWEAGKICFFTWEVGTQVCSLCHNLLGGVFMFQALFCICVILHHNNDLNNVKMTSKSRFTIALSYKLDRPDVLGTINNWKGCVWYLPLFRHSAKRFIAPTLFNLHNNPLRLLLLLSEFNRWGRWGTVSYAHASSKHRPSSPRVCALLSTTRVFTPKSGIKNREVEVHLSKHKGI